MDGQKDSQLSELQRARLIALIEENVNQLAAAGDGMHLEWTLELVGFHPALNEIDCDMLAAAIVALAPLLDDGTLGHVADNAVFYRSLESSGVERAYAIARAIVEPLGVRYTSCGHVCFADPGCFCAEEAARGIIA